MAGPTLRVGDRILLDKKYTGTIVLIDTSDEYHPILPIVKFDEQFKDAIGWLPHTESLVWNSGFRDGSYYFIYPQYTYELIKPLSIRSLITSKFR